MLGIGRCQKPITTGSVECNCAEPTSSTARSRYSLHVGPGALYWHFKDKQSLLGAIADALLADVDAPPSGETWDERLRDLAHRLRNALLSRRDGAELGAATYASRLVTNNIRKTFYH